MPYTPRSRNRYLALLSLVTGFATFGSVAATGAATGLAAGETARRDHEREVAASLARAAAARSAPQTITVTRQRPSKTVIRTRVVHRVSGPGVTAVGGGGAVSGGRAHTPAEKTTTSGTDSTPQPAPAPQRTPAPAPAPAPSGPS